MSTACHHLSQIVNGIKADSPACAECVEVGDRWVHLRICMTCGHVGCCDSSKNRHARKHVHATGHPIIQSFEPGEAWLYCFPDDVLIEADRKLYRAVG